MSDGLASMCKVPCRREVGREYRATNAESIRAKKSSPEALARQRELAKTEIGRAKERNRKRTGPGKRRQRDWTYRTKYGITLLEYEAMFKKQGGACAICQKQNLDGKALHVDHDHDTGMVRGLLCFFCNGTLGKIGGSFDLWYAFFDYMEKWKRIKAVRCSAT